MRSPSPFSPRVVVALLVVGAAAFLLFLYALGRGWNGGEDSDGGAHAAANGLNGFSALAELLRRDGLDVRKSRSIATLRERTLLILTPPVTAAGKDIVPLIEARRHIGPTLVILPKWQAMKAQAGAGRKVGRGWVELGPPQTPPWLATLAGMSGTRLSLAKARGWRGMGLAGALPGPALAAGAQGPGFTPLVRDDAGRALAFYVEDSGTYPVLARAAGVSARDPTRSDQGMWTVVVVAEPDLLNNYGMADLARARLARGLVRAAMEGQKLPVTFDLTLAGLGDSQNLLTLAFRPPFLAATLCLMIAGLVVAWRALRRFGPAEADMPQVVHGKAQLARNAAGLVERSGRLHLLGPPYAALLGGRIAARLGLRAVDVTERDRAAARLLAHRGVTADYSLQLETLRRARRRTELLRAASTLKSIERTL